MNNVIISSWMNSIRVERMEGQVIFGESIYISPKELSQIDIKSNIITWKVIKQVGGDYLFKL